MLGAVGMEVLGHYVVRRRLPTDEYGIVPYQVTRTARPGGVTLR